MITEERFETIHIGKVLIEKFIDGKITDLECLAAIRKLKSVYDLINRDGAV